MSKKDEVWYDSIRPMAMVLGRELLSNFMMITYEHRVLNIYHLKNQLEVRNSDLTRLFGHMR